MKQNNKFIVLVLIVIAILAIVFVFNNKKNIVENISTDHKNISYKINGQDILLTNGVSEIPAAPGSASTIVTQYFGNELVSDINNDGLADVSFILTQNTGGSGTMFYAVAAINTGNGYAGSDGYLLGDRIAPQSTNLSTNPKHVDVVVFNYADRNPGEPMTVPASMGKSAYLKINTETMQWGIVEPNFEGESR